MTDTRELLDPAAPHTPARTVQLAFVAAECTRLLNHATDPSQWDNSLTEVSTYFHVLDALCSAAGRLSVLAPGLRAALIAAQHAGEVELIPADEMPQGKAADPFITVAGQVQRTADALRYAGETADVLQRLLREAADGADRLRDPVPAPVTSDPTA